MEQTIKNNPVVASPRTYLALLGPPWSLLQTLATLEKTALPQLMCRLPMWARSARLVGWQLPYRGYTNCGIFFLIERNTTPTYPQWGSQHGNYRHIEHSENPLCDGRAPTQPLDMRQENTMNVARPNAWRHLQHYAASRR